MYSVKQVSDMSGRTERHIWRLIASGKLQHTKDADGRVWIAPEHVPAKRQVDLSSSTAILSRLAELERQFEALKQQLEQRQVVSSPRPVAAARVVVPRLVGGLPGEPGLPTSIRGRARWVELHGGARESGARMWHESAAWSSVSDAIEGIRLRGYTPHECATAGCECHALLDKLANS